jgi:DNA-binding Xre family transcriptional regulator
MMQGMTSTTHFDGIATKQPVRRMPTPAGIGDPVVAEFGAIRLLWCARRLRGDLTITEAARRVGLNRDELARIERGETKQIQFKTVAKLIVGYGCAVTDLFEVQPAVVEDESAPFYGGTLAALATGIVPNESAGRRTVRRSPDLDVIGEHEEAMFAASPEPPARRRRSPIGTAGR